MSTVQNLLRKFQTYLNEVETKIDAFYKSMKVDYEALEQRVIKLEDSKKPVAKVDTKS